MPVLKIAIEVTDAQYDLLNELRTNEDGSKIVKGREKAVANNLWHKGLVTLEILTPDTTIACLTTLGREMLI